jgi:hypothetical protein
MDQKFSLYVKKGLCNKISKNKISKAENPESSKSRKLRISNDSKSRKTQNLEKLKNSSLVFFIALLLEISP